MPTTLHASLLPIIEGNTFCIGQMSPHITDDILNTSVESSNEFGRILGHIIASRNGLTTFLGGNTVDLGWGTFGEFSMTAQFESENACPTTADLIEKWTAVSNAFGPALKNCSEEALAADGPFPIPLISNASLAGIASFMIFHETYHIGQLSLIFKAATGKGPFDSME